MKILSNTIDVKFNPTEWEALKTICAEWRQMVRHSNRYGDNVQSNDMNEFISNVLKLDSEAGFKLVEAENLCIEILNREKNP